MLFRSVFVLVDLASRFVLTVLPLGSIFGSVDLASHFLLVAFVFALGFRYVAWLDLCVVFFYTLLSATKKDSLSF
jgi:hypothetical protein